MLLRPGLVCLFILYLSTTSHGQSSCVNIAPVSPVCQGGSTLLQATLQPGCINGSNSYTFEVQSTYSPEPFTGGTAIDPSFTNCTSQNWGSHDDCWAGPFDIGFQFCFFNRLYSQFWVGSNGWVSFSGPPNTPTASWCAFTSQPLPNQNTSAPKNAIFAPWEDWLPTYPNPATTQNVFYYMSGTVPNRKLVVYWLNCRLYACSNTATIQGTFQIVLNEQGGVIDNHIQDKPACSNYNATQGVQNNDGTIAFWATGRNNTQWTATNESTRFVPSGITWYTSTYPGGTIAGYGAQITVTPPVTTTYYCEVETCNFATEVQAITVTVLPHPSITGPAGVCDGSSTTYTTESGMNSYVWAVTGGTITSGGNGSNTVTVLWNVATGLHNLTVNYNDPVTACVGITPTVYPVTYHIPAPIILSGGTDPCENAAGNVYTTMPGNTGYSWNVSINGTITTGGNSTDNSVTVTWTNSIPGQVSVNYADANGCISASAGIVQVAPFATPLLTIPTQKTCTGQSINISLTSSNPDPRVSFSWPAPVCNNIASGCPATGGSGKTISLNPVLGASSPGSVIYTVTPILMDCTGPPTQLTVNVNPPPLPAINGNQTVCSNFTEYTYTTGPGMMNYTWSVTGGIITSGSSGSSPTIMWTSAGSQAVTVSYTDPATNCTGSSLSYPVFVNDPPVPVISANPAVPVSPCGNTQVTYSIGAPQPNHSYQWTISGGTPLSGNSSSIAVSWGNTNPVSVNVVESITLAPGLVCSVPATKAVTLNLIPDLSGPIAGPSVICQGLTKTFSVNPIPNSDSYTWWYVAPTGVSVVNSGSSADLTFGSTSSSGSVFVQGNKTNCASGPASSPHSITVHSFPFVALSACNDPVTTTTSKPFTIKGGVPPTGQYYIDGVHAIGATVTPSLLSAGIHQITYSVTDLNNCSNTATSVPLTVIAGSPAGTCAQLFSDPRDNHAYPAFLLGGRCWMLSNLSYGTATSDMLPQTDNCIPQKYCLASDANCLTYGGLYQWEELMQYQPDASVSVHGICPPEWHIPDQSEWQNLIDAVSSMTAGDGIAGSYLKDPNISLGFNALTSGIFYMNNIWAFISGNPTATMFWTSTTDGSTRAIARGLNSLNYSVSFYPSSRTNAFTVRCVKDY